LVYSPNANLSFYGTYAEGLEPGGEAPAEANNAGGAMDPSKSKQYEIGIKADISPDLNVTAALFEIKRPFEFVPTPVPFKSSAYEVAGEERRRGLELAANGRVTRDLLIGASMTTLLADVDGDARVAGKRIGNVPRYKAVVYGDYTMPSMPALRLNASLQYASSKLFAPNGDVQTRVSGYHVVNVGAQYKTKLSGVNTTFRFGINNLFDRFYWGDTASAFGGYLIPGAPRVFRLSAQLDF
jgi:iron complex outermembrane receptor protein